jgi:hypothetical protein
MYKQKQIYIFLKKKKIILFKLKGSSKQMDGCRLHHFCTWTDPNIVKWPHQTLPASSNLEFKMEIIGSYPGIPSYRTGSCKKNENII